MAELEKLYDPLIGQKVGNGQCGALTSDYMRYMTGCKYQWAGEYGNGQLPPGVKTAGTCWQVYTEADWSAIGFEYINKPTKEQVKADDTFYIAPRPNLPTGHTGLVASVVNGNITTFEQNVLNAQYVQKLSGANSWDWYGGFDGIVRKKAAPKPPNNNSGNNSGNNPQPQKGEIEMYLIYTIDKQNWYVSNGVQCKWVKTERMLKNYQDEYGKLNLRVDKMYSSELYKEFPQNKIIK
ncbi:CHAP domain-containing protein [Lactococcus formosensis]|uniref:CHAP domain-containing protein n=1 Tax=Lactococcus formosensis TaxID=1281486 RepID=UPI00254D0F78|nr:CHAP domain-containing protein [Lactococcus formosensis]